MTTKTTGAEWKRFYTDKTVWPDGAYHEDVVVHINGVHNPEASLEDVPDDAEILIESGYIMLPDGKDSDLNESFIKWRDAQNIANGLFEAPKELMETVKAAITAAGGKVL